MTVDTLDHVTINTSDLEACLAFYLDALGFEDGPRPELGIPGAWLYCGGNPVVHIMAMPDASAGPTGPVDHVAFRCTGIEDFKKRLSDHGCDYDENNIADFNLRQLFVHDPDGVKVELNFFEAPSK